MDISLGDALTISSILVAATAMVVTIRVQSANVTKSMNRLSIAVDRLDDNFNRHDREIAVIQEKFKHTD